ncbi:hypothetical protein VOI54_10845 [Tamlana sp. 2201CG12-4]|uniref:hypothetical protein n=1 Tax=Tamlana sp. 2201CG12-4 TaxID=3112582 RepID=UPI002DB84697|nr:hypothetical protein [Tamlana sp. 2201CG12-4]MEC3907517.1 hypothetical protein [Tamlana sp. 2201CG12-4]
MQKVFYTFVLLSVSLMSCESNSDDESSSPDTSNNILTTKVDIAYSNGATETLHYTYSGMTLIKEESSDGYYTDYIYEDNKLTEINYYDSPNPGILESYTYDAQERIATISTNIVGIGVYDYTVTYNANNSVITTSYTNGTPDKHTVNNGNIVSFDEGGVYNSTYTYDSKNGPFKNIANRDILLTINSENSYALNFALNNLLTEDIVETATSTNNSYTYTHTYTTFGFPRVTTEDDEGDITTYTYTYNND